MSFVQLLTRLFQTSLKILTRKPKARVAAAVVMSLVVCAVVATQFVSRAFNSNPEAKVTHVRVSQPSVAQPVVKTPQGERIRPYKNLRNGHEMPMQYAGNQTAQALLAGGAEGRVLATADLDGDGAPDLIAGYAANGAGIVTVQRGDVEAYAPRNAESFAKMQAGANPDSVLPTAETFQVPEAADYVVTGDFNGDGLKDVAVGAHSGGLYLLAGDGHGSLGAPQHIELPGALTALAAGDLNLADGKTELAVGITGSGGNTVQIYEGSSGEFKSVAAFSLSGEAVAIQFAQLRDGAFGDVAVADGQEITLVHGGAQLGNATVERLSMPFGVQGLAIGNFVWDREAQPELAVLGDDGQVRVLEQSGIDKRPFTEQDLRARRASRDNPRVMNRPDQWLFMPRSEPGKGRKWSQPHAFGTSQADTGRVSSQARLVRSNIGRQETDEVLVVDAGQKRINMVRERSKIDANQSALTESGGGEFATESLDMTDAPAAILGMPAKVNGSSDLVMLTSSKPSVNIVPLVATSITVDRTDDNASASACTVAANDCSLRGAVAFANIAGNSPATINIPAGTYNLTIAAGAIEFGGVNICSHPEAGDLDINLNTTVVGAGAATTIIAQTTTQDRVLCLNPNVIAGRTYSISGVTVTGGREPSKYGGAGLVGGAKTDSTTISSSTFTDNQAWNSGACAGCTDFGSGGGAIKIEGGTLNVTNCTLGTNSLPSALGAAKDITKSNIGGAGGGVNYSPGAPLGCVNPGDCPGDLNMTGTTVKFNQAFSIASGGGGVDLYQHNLGSGTHNIGTSTINNNQATGGGTPNVGGGGGIILETGPLVVTSGVSITSNTANGNGGGMQMTGGSTTLNSTGGAITFSGNAANAAGAVGSGIAANSNVTVSGTLLSITNDVDVQDNCTWTNNAGSAVAISNLRMADINAGGNVGTYTANNSTTTLTGNLTVAGGIYSANTGTAGIGGNLNITSGTFNNGTTTNLTGNLALSGGTFNGSSGAVNITGNFTFSGGAFNANTSTFTFNSANPQSINGPSSPTFNNLTKTGAGTLTLAVNSPIAGNLNVSAGTLDLSTFAANRTAAGGTLTVASGATLKIGGTGTLPSNFSTHSIGATSTINYSGTNQNVATLNSSQKYGNLVTSGSATKTLAGNLTLPSGIATSLTIGAGTTLDVSASNFGISFTGTTWTNSGTFTPRSGTVTFDPTAGTQTLVGNTSFFNLTLQNTGATTDLGSGTNTIQSTLSKTAGSMVGGSGTTVFSGNPGAISGAGAKEFNNLTISGNVTATGGNITLLNDFTNNGTYNQSTGNLTLQNNFTNNGTFTQASGSTTTFATGADGNHSNAGSGTTTTFGVFAINASNTLDAGSLNFNVIGATFTVDGTFTGNTSTVTFNGGAAQGIAGNGAKNFSGLTINDPGFAVTVINGTGAVDASVSGALTLTTDLTVSSTGPAILQQSGTSAGAGDVIGTVRRTDLGVTERAFGNPTNTITVGTGTAPTQMDFNLVKSAPGTFPASVKVVPRDYTLTPTGGSGFTATLKLHYLDSELVGPGITESRLVEWKNVGGTTWTAQGGTVDTTNNFVSLPGVTSFSEWALAEGSDLTLTKANNVSNAAVTGQPWNWTLTATNGGAPATFAAGQTIILDNLPNANLNYGTPTVQNVSNVTGNANISCSITSNDLTCTANGGSVTFDSNLGVSKFDVVFSATPQVVASYQNPRTGGGVAQIDPNNNVVESSESNNSATANTVTVTKASTTTTITNSVALGTATVVGEPYAVNWSVTVNAPGGVGAALTGNVTVSDGSQTCVAAVSALTCNLTSTTPGAPKTITATYAGDTNYNASPASAGVSHTVNKANTTTTITEDNPDPSNTSQSVTVKWTVTVDSPGAGTPTGNVNVTVSGGAETCSAAVGAGQCSLTLTTTGTRTITATYVGDTNFNTSNDTESHDVINANIAANNAKVAEPASGTANMLFTVTLSAAAPASGVTVHYATADQAPAPGHAVAGVCGSGGDYVAIPDTVLSFASGEQFKTIAVTVCADADNSEPDETFVLNLSNATNGIITTAQGVGTITVANTAGTFVISEFRERGLGGAGDDFVEMYNNTNSPQTVAASDVSGGYGVYKMGTTCNDTPVLIGTIPNGTIIPARGHYLLVGSAYSLANYGGTGAAAGNQTMTSDIEDDRNIAVFSTANVVNISSANRLDAVGAGTNTGNVCDLMREGNNLGAVGAMNIDYSWFRKLFTGNPQDTNDNSADFFFADTQGTFISGIPQHLGAPGPENLASPIRRDNSGILLPLIDGTLTSSSSPNRFRNFANVIAVVAPNGTLDIRRRVQNTTGSTVTRLRFRIVDITTFPSPGAATADLRVISSSAVVISGINDPATCASTGTPTSTPCQVTAQATTLETPPAQANGGGYNSTVTVSIPGGLANNASVDVNFQLGVIQAGTFRFKLIVEALP